MTGLHRARRFISAALTPVFVLGLAACTGLPNTIFGAHSEVGHAEDRLTYLLLILGGIVFVLIEGALIYAVVRFRARPNASTPSQTHGNTKLEVTWTLIPAVILAIIAVPSIRTIFETEATAATGALQVEVIGHQWWWEFRYPQYKIVTANELYLPVGRTANFSLRTDDVIHSFWIPQLAGKRDVVHKDRPNWLWFTPDSIGVWNGFCAEYCGTSHSNMRFRVFTVSPDQFKAWVAHQQTGPAFAVAAPAPAPADTGKKTGATPPAPVAAVALTSADTNTATVPHADLPKWTVPETPLPAGLSFDQNAIAKADPARGAQIFKTAACIGCHTIQGVSMGIIGPNLTHVGSRTTIGAALYPNDMKHLTMWIKDARLMKPGSIMPPMAKGLPESMGMFDDQQIADLAAYLSSLK
ncbi:MAG TPA: cytochrome c oxidase subunit II [Gemmatimonadaceae bacterium]|jgi:cytochrome c oxidase subunit 2